MPTATYTPLANITLTASASTVTFGSIPNSYKDLILISNIRHTNGGVFYYRFNGDSANNYSFVRMWGENSSGFSSSGSDSRGYLGDLVGGGTSTALNRLQIMDYSASDKHKVSVSVHTYDPNIVAYNAFVTAGRWASNTAINSITLLPMNANAFQSNSTFALFGIVG